MDNIVLMRQVPDIVEELVIDPERMGLDLDEVSFVTNELDEHALEQAILMKEQHGGKVSVLSVGGEEARGALAMAVAKGADVALHVVLEEQGQSDNHRLATFLAGMIKGWNFDLLLTGVQAVDDLDGSLGSLLATHLAMPYVGGLAAVEADPHNQRTMVHKEFPGGLLAKLEVTFPAILGIQSANQPPRYVPVSKVMQARKAMEVEALEEELPETSGLSIIQMALPEPSQRAKMLEGEADEIVDQLAVLLQERGLL